jgi:hypothetical protein
MTYYRATITGGRYPTEYNVEASDWPTAAARALRQWKKRFKGERTDTVKLQLVRVQNIRPYIDPNTDEIYI